MKNQIDWEVGNNLKDIKAIYKMIGNSKIIIKYIMILCKFSYKKNEILEIVSWKDDFF